MAGSVKDQVLFSSTCRQPPCFVLHVTGVRIWPQSCGSGELNNAGKIEDF